MKTLIRAVSLAIGFVLLAGPVSVASPAPQDEQIQSLMNQAGKAENAKNWHDAKSIYQRLIATDPNRWEFYQGLGNAQFNLKEYQEALHSYEKGTQLAQNILSDPSYAKPDQPERARAKDGIGQMLTQTGNAYLKMRKNKEALAAYHKAAESSPNPSVAYFNICATSYNMGDMEGAETACKKAIAVDPNRADSYYVAGSAMFSRGNLNANKKYVTPPGTADYLKKYLQLAPNGQHAKDAQEMLNMIE